MTNDQATKRRALATLRTYYLRLAIYADGVKVSRGTTKTRALYFAFPRAVSRDEARRFETSLAEWPLLLLGDPENVENIFSLDVSTLTETPERSSRAASYRRRTI